MYIPKIRQIITPNCRICIPKAEKTLPARAKKVQELSDAFQKKILLIADKTLSFQDLHKIILDNKELSNVSLGIVPKYVESCHACIGTDITVEKSASKDFDADLNYSIFIGDNYTDMLCAQNAGVRFYPIDFKHVICTRHGFRTLIEEYDDKLIEDIFAYANNV